MKAVSDMNNGVLEFSRSYFGETERGEGFMGQTWTGSTDSKPGTEPRWEGVAPVSQLAAAAWGVWLDRGIPELASPLAD